MTLSERLRQTAHLTAPVLAVDLAAFDANASELLHRAGGRPVRVATKSVRVPTLIDRALAAGFRGLMAYSLPEALWWVRRGATDVLVGYPSVDRRALAELVADAAARAAVTLMVDHRDHLAMIADALGATPSPADGGHEPRTVRVCVDVDASLRLGPGLPARRRAHLGVRRSPLHSVPAVVDLARRAEATDGVVVRGLMFYEGQVAGLPDTSLAVRAVKRASLAELAVRRGAVVGAVEAALGHRLELVNGGGTGSLEATARDAAVTELTSGSGLLAPTLFDGYQAGPRAEPLTPAAFIGLDVVRRPGPGVVTVFSGGFIASGPTGPGRAPLPVIPEGLRLTRSEGAGEVQTPLRGGVADSLAIGERVWLRHAKAGEVMERFAEVALVADDVALVPTYRGLGLTFG